MFGKVDLIFQSGFAGIFEAMKRYVATLVYSNYWGNKNQTITRKLLNPCLKVPQFKGSGDDFFADFPKRPTEIFSGPCTWDHLPDKRFKDKLKQLMTDPSFEFDFEPNKEVPCHDSITPLHMHQECAKLFGETVCQLNFKKGTKAPP